MKYITTREKLKSDKSTQNNANDIKGNSGAKNTRCSTRTSHMKFSKGRKRYACYSATKQCTKLDLQQSKDFLSKKKFLGDVMKRINKNVKQGL